MLLFSPFRKTLNLQSYFLDAAKGPLTNAKYPSKLIMQMIVLENFG